MNDKKRDWKQWTKAAGVRAIKTMAQAGIAAFGSAAVLSEVNFGVVVSTMAVAGILSVLTSITGLPEVPDKDEEGG